MSPSSLLMEINILAKKLHREEKGYGTQNQRASSGETTTSL